MGMIVGTIPISSKPTFATTRSYEQKPISERAAKNMREMADANLSQGGAAIDPASHAHAEPRRHPPPSAKCPCEARIDGKLCRKESDSMTAMGKLLCKEHREAEEKKWNIVINRLQTMA